MSQPIETPPLPGDQVGSYRLGDMLGVGGMATVYKAVHPDRGLVALKVLHPGKAETEDARRFRREFLTLREIDHPSVVRVYEAGRHGVYPWLAMEYVDGVDLGTLVERWAEDPPADRFQRVEVILRDLCEALASVHARGLVHRDLKPSNVLITSTGRAKLTDFGVVKASGGQFTTQLTVVGKLVGTVAFMAPEQITGEAVDGRVDLYSLGAVLYVMLTGHKPIVADTIAGYLARHLTEDPIPPSEHDPRVPARLERIALKLMQKDPARRFASAEEVLAALDTAGDVDRPAVYGRDAEIARLISRMEEAQRGVGGMIVLVGPAGIGRSSLLRELAARARCRFPLAMAEAGDDAPLQRLVAQLPPAPGEGMSVATRLLQRVRSRPQILILDDVDRLSPADLDSLTAVVREALAIQGEPLLVLVSTLALDGAVGAFCSGAATGLSPERLSLAGLDRRAVIALVRDQGVEGPAGAALGDRLQADLDGVPGAILEQLSALVSAGWLRRAADGGLRPTRSLEALRTEALPVPDRVRSREIARLQALGYDERRVVDALLVLDLEATADLVADVAGLDMGSVECALEGLARDGIAAGRIEGVQELWRIAQPRSRELLYSLMDSDSRASLHAATAAALTRRSRRRGATFTDVIAGHLLRAGRHAEAWPLLIASARRMLRAGRLDEARRMLRQANDAQPAALPAMAPDKAQACRQELYALEGEVLERCGDLTGALGAWERALALASQSGEAEAVARARSGLGLVRAARGEADAAADGLEHAISELPQGDPMWTRVAQALANARLVRGDGAGARQLWEELEQMGDELGGTLATEARVGLAILALARGEMHAGRAMLEDAETQLRSQAAGKLVLARTLIMLAEMAHADGRLIEASERAAEAGRIAREVPRTVLVVRSLGIGAMAHAARGDLVEARRLAREGVALIQSRGRVDTAPELLAVIAVARGLCGAGETEAAADLLPEAPIFGPSSLEDPIGLLLAVRARARADRDPAGASEDAWGALGRTPAPLPWHAALLTLDAGYGLVRAGDGAVDAAVVEALDRTEVAGLRLLRLAALNLGYRIGLGAELAVEADLLRQRLFAELGRPPAFLQRWRG